MTYGLVLGLTNNTNILIVLFAPRWSSNLDWNLGGLVYSAPDPIRRV